MKSLHCHSLFSQIISEKLKNNHMPTTLMSQGVPLLRRWHLSFFSKSNRARQTSMLWLGCQVPGPCWIPSRRHPCCLPVKSLNQCICQLLPGCVFRMPWPLQLWPFLVFMILHWILITVWTLNKKWNGWHVCLRCKGSRTLILSLNTSSKCYSASLFPQMSKQGATSLSMWRTVAPGQSTEHSHPHLWSHLTTIL